MWTSRRRASAGAGKLETDSSAASWNFNMDENRRGVANQEAKFSQQISTQQRATERKRIQKDDLVRLGMSGLIDWSVTFQP